MPTSLDDQTPNNTRLFRIGCDSFSPKCFFRNEPSFAKESEDDGNECSLNSEEDKIICAMLEQYGHDQLLLLLTKRLEDTPLSHAKSRASTYFALHRTHLAAGRVEEATKCYDEARKLHPQEYSPPSKPYFSVNRPARLFLKHDNQSIQHQSFGLDPRDFSNGKVFVSGLWKSGTSWLLELLVETLNMPVIYDHNISKYEVAASCCVFMIHESLDSPHNKFGDLSHRDDVLHGVYILRDIRDVVVSMFHYTKTDWYMDRHGQSAASFYDIDMFYYDFFLSYFVPRFDWLNHACSYVQRGIPIIRYEDLWDRPLDELSRLFRRWGLVVEQPAIQGALEKFDANKMIKDPSYSPDRRSKIAETDAKGLRWYSNLSQVTLRKGGHGGFRKELSPKLISDMNERFRDYLLRWGYEID